MLQQKQFNFARSLYGQQYEVCYELDSLQNHISIENKPIYFDEDYFRLALKMQTSQMGYNENRFNKGSLWELAVNFSLGMPLHQQLSTNSRSNIPGSTSYDLKDSYGKRIEVKTHQKLISATKKPRFFTAIQKSTNDQGDWTTVKDAQAYWYCKSDARDVLKSAQKYSDLFITNSFTVLNGRSSEQKLKAFEVIKEYLSSLGWDSMYIIQTPSSQKKVSCTGRMKNEIKEIYKKLIIYEITKDDFIQNAFFKTSNNNVDCKIIYNPEFLKCLYSKSIKDIYDDQVIDKDKTKTFVETFLQKIGLEPNLIEEALR